jgi:hypothetical protein
MNRVAIDVDEVLVKFLFPMANHHHQLHKLRSKPKYGYVYRHIFEIDEPASQKMVHEFYQSKDFMELTPIQGSQKAMFNLRQNVMIKCISSLDGKIWLEKKRKRG